MQELIRMLGAASDRLRYLSPSVQSLIRTLAAQYPTIAFLGECRRGMDQGKPFPESFAGALEVSSLPDAAKDALSPLSGQLGGADLESQLAAIAFAVSRLREQAEQAREHFATHGKLYQTLGTLGGVAAAIMLC